jgi:four helix bundle protein
MANDQGPMSKEDCDSPRAGFDLEERTARFGESVIAFAKRIPVNPVTMPLISQVVRAATSVGANYCEADEAESGKEFRYRIGVCKREARETKHQVRMIAAAQPELRDDGADHLAGSQGANAHLRRHHQEVRQA